MLVQSQFGCGEIKIILPWKLIIECWTSLTKWESSFRACNTISEKMVDEYHNRATRLQLPFSYSFGVRLYHDSCGTQEYFFILHVIYVDLGMVVVVTIFFYFIAHNIFLEGFQCWNKFNFVIIYWVILDTYILFSCEKGVCEREWLNVFFTGARHRFSVNITLRLSVPGIFVFFTIWHSAY